MMNYLFLGMRVKSKVPEALDAFTSPNEDIDNSCNL